MEAPEHSDAAARLDGQVALVTGGGRGLGRSMALALSAAGAAVAVCARSEDQAAETVGQIEARNGHALAIRADVSDRHAVERMVERVEREFGPIDLLVNNAGVGGPTGALAATDPDTWWQALEINLRGPLYCSRAVLPGMLSRGRGRIVNISSDAGFQAFPMMSAYAVSKAALYRLTENLAVETREQGVQVFAIYPGLVRTAMVEAALHCGEPSIEQLFQRLLAEGDDIPPERAADLVVFLASGKADLLSGRFFSARENAEDLVRRANEIQDRDLYVLRQRV
jgi:NAD(P)-dependent dehydrogenase (short-subunit alcohol dehydrogenase family)